MSMVTVHGPNTMYTDAPGVAKDATGTVTATTNPSNGLQFTATATGARPAGDYVWTASASGVCVPTTGTGPIVVTFPAGAAGANQTITCTVAAGAGPPTAGAYAATVKPVVGTPRMVEQSVEPDMSSPALKPEELSDDDVFDPAEFTVDEVVAWAEENPDQLDDLIAAEEAGKNRSTLVHRLNALKE